MLFFGVSISFSFGRYPVCTKYTDHSPNYCRKGLNVPSNAGSSTFDHQYRDKKGDKDGDKNRNNIFSAHDFHRPIVAGFATIRQVSLAWRCNAPLQTGRSQACATGFRSRRLYQRPAGRCRSAISDQRRVRVVLPVPWRALLGSPARKVSSRPLSKYFERAIPQPDTAPTAASQAWSQRTVPSGLSRSRPWPGRLRPWRGRGCRHLRRRGRRRTAWRP